MERRVGAPLAAIKAIYYTIMSWLLVHVSACVWYHMVCHRYSEVFEGVTYCIAPSWIYSGSSTISWWSSHYGPKLVPLGNRNIHAGIFDHGEGSTDYLLSNNQSDLVRVNATVGDRYFYSLYWAVTTMTTAGYKTTNYYLYSIEAVLFLDVLTFVG